MKVYFISGIAADSRMFKHIRLPDGFEAVYLNYIKPVKNETLSTYAARLAEKIDRTETFYIIGTSLGSIMASEISISHKPVSTIIIASVPVTTQLPAYYRVVRKLGIQKLIPGALYKWSAIAKHFFSFSPREDKRINIGIIRDTDPAFISWGINAVLNWSNTQMPENLIHIHGIRDEVFPYAHTSPTHTIRKGGHVLVITHADDINKIIRQVLV